MLHLVLGPAGSGKTAYINNQLRESVEKRQRGLFLIVPEQYSHEAERELCAVCGDSLSLYAEVLSFSRLAIRVAQQVGGAPGVYLDKGGRLLCMTLALEQIRSRLKLFSGSRPTAEQQDGLLKAVTELKTAGIDAEKLRQAASSAPARLGEKLSDLSLCMETYNAVLAQGHLDPADRLLRLAEDIGKSSVGSGGHIYIDGFTDFTGAEIKVIEALLAKNADITVCLTCDSPHGESEHFAPARLAVGALLALAKQYSAEAELFYPEAEAGKAPALSIFRDRLFSFTTQVFGDPERSLNLYRCDTDGEQCELAAERALYLVRETGCRWRDIAVACRGFGDFAPGLESVFRRYGIPLFTPRRSSILQKPVPALISAAYDIVLGGWDTDSVLAYLKTGLTGMELSDLDILQSYALRWGIKGSMWTKSGDWKQHPAGLSALFDEKSTALLSKINLLRRALVLPLQSFEKKCRSAATGGGQAAALAELLEDISLPKTLELRAELLAGEQQSLLAAETSQLWELTLSALEQFASLLGELPMNADSFSKLFLKMLSQYDVSSIPLSADSVSAGEVDRMRRRHIKHLIIIGASDDRLPAVSGDTGFFSAEERDELSALGLPLGGAGDGLERELSLIYNCVSLPSDSLTLAYCATDSSGGQSRPSLLISRAQLLFNHEIKPFDPLTARLSAPEPAFMLAACALNGGTAEQQLALEHFSRLPEDRQHLESLALRADLSRGSLSPRGVQELYGQLPRLSPSKADAFFSCRYFYYLRYGLRLNEKEVSSFDPPELGIFMHYVLENAVGEISRTTGFKSTDETLAAALAQKYTDLYIQERLGGLDDKTPRFIYIFDRQRLIVQKVVINLLRELSVSDFVPLDFELSFAGDGDLPPVEISDLENRLLITGTADRVDGLFRDGKLYLRIIDYKTGRKAFSLSDVWYGMGLQMLIYLFAIQREGQQRYGCPVEPAGVLYVPARDPLISSPSDLTDLQLAAAKSKKLRRSGLLLNNPEILAAMERSDSPEFLPLKYKKDGTVSQDSLADEKQLADLHRHVDKKLLELSVQLRQGSITPTPCYRSENDNACLFCPYGSVCRFDEGRDSRRYLRSIDTAQFWQSLEENHE